MITFDSLLAPKFVDLDLKATNHEEAVAHVAGLLRHDPRVTDWPKLYEAIQQRSPGVAGGRDFDISIPHARTDAVNTMVMSVGRSVTGIEFQEEGSRVHYIFVIGVPVPLAADYLRIVGSIARIFRNPHAEQLMRTTDDPAEFIRHLATGEMKH